MHIIIAYILSDLKMVTSDCLGHDKFKWEVLMFIFLCSGWHYCGIAHLYKNLPVEETVSPIASNPGPGELQSMLVFVVSQLLIN